VSTAPAPVGSLFLELVGTAYTVQIGG